MEIFIILIVNVIDRVTKMWASKSLINGNDVVVIKNIFSFSYLENRGAAWGIFQGKVNFLLIITLIIIIGMVVYLLKYKPKSKLIRISLSLIIGGALGNMFDRGFYKYVVDYIYFHYNDLYSFPTFNFADMSVVVGTILLVVCLIKDEK
ncbi:signal peptidase II [Clostridium acidisoli DSM 12555]|uniref:Lipoprotein signal peptidase n=1 Tax=Clostridium acidisoli DSM 12555 TaxID=1121291 RepID=A0A1W1X1E5_9CLOT|nr:signal peptidase II [Clostridium acidisoli]SMC17663.1 signal peptidase II [Clostridium acidisoli DSM 12555]